MDFNWEKTSKIIAAQAIDHTLVFGISVILLALATNINFQILAEVLQSTILFVTYLIVLFVIGFSYRLLSLLFFEQSLGCYILKIKAKIDSNWTVFVGKLIIESVQGSLPILWAIEILLRRLSRNIGFDYVYVYR